MIPEYVWFVLVLVISGLMILVKELYPKEDPIYAVKETLSIHEGRLDHLEDELKMILDALDNMEDSR